MLKFICSLLLFLLSASLGFAGDFWGDLDGRGYQKISIIDLEKVSEKKIAILIHGAASESDYLLPLGIILKDRGYEPIQYRYNTDERASDLNLSLKLNLNALIWKINPDEVLIIGHSLGGILARKTLEEITLTPKITFISISSPFKGMKILSSLKNPLIYQITSLVIKDLKKSFIDMAAKSEFLNSYKGIPSHIKHHQIITDEEGEIRIVHINGKTIDKNDNLVAIEEQTSDLIGPYLQDKHQIKNGHVSVVNSAGKVSANLAQLLDELEL